jgi:hypothetical protein
VLLLAAGCSSIKEFVPIHSSAAAMRIPNQQRILSEATLAAVNQAVSANELNLNQLAGKTVVVDADGVFPHSRTDLFAYLVTAFEGELSRRGVRVLPRALPSELRIDEGARGAQVSLTPPAPESLHADARVAVSVDWGGIDYQDNKHVSVARATGMAVVGVFTFGLGAIIWRLAQTPMVHTLTLKARVHITVRVIPVQTGLRFAMASGSGESQIAIDQETDSGYTNQMTVPEKAE